MEHIIHILGHTVWHVFLETLKILPFLFVMYLFLEWMEHRAGEKSEKMVSRTGRAGPLFGGLLGLLPQCGFSTAAAGLYSGGIITVGTLLAVFLATSDEMIAVMFSGGIKVSLILTVLAYKLIVAIIAGFAVDCFWKKKDKKNEFENHCHEEGCHCDDHGIFLSALFHSVKIFVFILVVSIAIHTSVELLGEERLARLFSDVPVVSNLLAAIIGLIPNCAASVVITELYVSGVISLGAMLSGLLVGAGAGLLVLLRVNTSTRENLRFTALLFATGTLGGIIADFIGLEGLFV